MVVVAFAHPSAYWPDHGLVLLYTNQLRKKGGAAKEVTSQRRGANQQQPEKEVMMFRFLTPLVLALVVFSGSALAQVGPSPQSDDHLVTLAMPEWVGVWCSGDVTFDFSAMPGFPPAAVPSYFYPTNPAASPYQSVRCLAVTRNDWELSVSGSGDFDDGTGVNIPLGRLEWDVSGVGAWTNMTTANAGVVIGSGPGMQWVDIDYRYEYQGDETDGTYTTTITYEMAITP